MKISIYTTVKNGLYFDYPIKEMLLHHLPLADEILVNEGYSTDSTFEHIKDLHSKIRIIRTEWDFSNPTTVFAKIKNDVRRCCTGDWCISLDCDEFIPEWQFDEIKETLRTTNKYILKLNYLNFYANYKVYNAKPEHLKWMKWKYAIHKNIQNMQVWGDGSNICFKESNDNDIYGDTQFMCHHFGMVRDPARLREKWRIQSSTYGTQKFRWLKIPQWVYRWFPFKWLDKDILEDLDVYEGPFVAPVRNHPQRFTKDNMQVYNYIKSVDL